MPKYCLILVFCFLFGCASAPTVTPTSEPTLSVTVTPIIGDTTPVFPVATSTTPFDALLIDTLLALHQNAITLAQSGLTTSEHEELRTFAQTLIDTQIAQSQQMTEWRALWYA